MMIEVLSASTDEKYINQIFLGCKSSRLLIYIQLIQFPAIIVGGTLCRDQKDGIVLRVHKAKTAKREEVQSVTIVSSLVCSLIHIIHLLP
jgi:hypothetical protein